MTGRHHEPEPCQNILVGRRLVPVEDLAHALGTEPRSVVTLIRSGASKGLDIDKLLAAVDAGGRYEP